MLRSRHLVHSWRAFLDLDHGGANDRAMGKPQGAKKMIQSKKILIGGRVCAMAGAGRHRHRLVFLSRGERSSWIAKHQSCTASACVHWDLCIQLIDTAFLFSLASAGQVHTSRCQCAGWNPVIFFLGHSTPKRRGLWDGVASWKRSNEFLRTKYERKFSPKMSLSVRASHSPAFSHSLFPEQLNSKAKAIKILKNRAHD